MKSTEHTPSESPMLEELANKWGVEIQDIPQISNDVIESLQLSQGSGHGIDDFEELLDDIATDILKDSPKFTENLAIIRNNRSSAEDKYTAKNKQIALYSATKRYILSLADMDQDLSVDPYEQARKHIHGIITRDYEVNGGDANPLKALRIIQEDAEGNDYFRFPIEIMPKNTTNKWFMYMDSVKAHIRAESSLRRGTATPSDLKQADEHRKIAHDSIARDMMSLLDTVNFEEMRRTVAKMRDNSFPNVETGEVKRVNSYLQEGVSVVEAMRKHLFPEGEFLPNPDEHLHH